MPPSVLDGRIVKASKGKTSSTALIKRRNWLQLLAEYTAEIKYFYFYCGYTRAEIPGVMERMFKIGATPKDYEYFLNQPEFKKNLTDEEWNILAPYYFACTALNIKVAVKKHSGYVVEPSAVKKGIGRFLRPKDNTNTTFTEPGEPYTFGALTAFNPDNVIPHQPIPKTIISKLPCGVTFRLLVQTCLKISQETGQNFGDLLSSSTFCHLWRLLYQVSNNLLSGFELDKMLDAALSLPPTKWLASPRTEEKVCSPGIDEGTATRKGESLGLRQLLKTLLSTNTIPMKPLVENLLPILIFRLDEDIISHIFNMHGAESITVKWYVGLLEIDLGQRMGYFFKTVGDSAYLYQKYNSHHFGPDYIKYVRQFLIQGIGTHLPVALTSQEAAALVAYTIYDGDITLEFMQLLFPLTLTLSNIEEQYRILYGTSVLDLRTRFTLKDFVSFGFRRNIHILALEAVVENNYEKASVLLPHPELALSSRQLQDLDLGALSPSYGNVWDIVGKNKLGELLYRAEEEARDPTCKQFTLDLIKTHPQLHGRGIESIVVESIHTMDPPESSLRIASVFDQNLKTGVDRGEVEKARLFHDLVDSESRGNIEKYRGLEEKLHAAVWARDSSSTRFLIECGARVNEKNVLGEAPIITAIIQERDDGPDRTDAEIRDEIDIFIQLLRAKADIDCLEEFRVRTVDGLHHVDPNFLQAVRDRDETQITRLWRTRFCEIDDNDTENDSDYEEPKQRSLSPVEAPPFRVEIWRKMPERIDSFSAISYIKKLFLRYLTNHERQESIQNIIQCFLEGSKKSWRMEDILRLDRAFHETSVTLLQYLAVFGSIHLLQSFFQLHPQEFTAQMSQIYPTSPSPLQLAAACNNLDCVAFLIKKGEWSVWHGNLDMAQYLLEHGADIHARKLSIQQGTRDLTRKLLWPQGPEDGDLSVLELAVILGRTDCVALFLTFDKHAIRQALRTATEHRQEHIVTLIQDTWGTELPSSEVDSTKTLKSMKRKAPRRAEYTESTTERQMRQILPKA
ncbi:uncharacterized protein DFL_002047 [Arthrobotrys flagrans]|uniref:Uncharacterized protein n=1 Tax=Arthrobotrys flagrans TaxID=97331 RepID=A0A437AAC6_ARTFL|nr:hypothetical protein DFL_002047 [Arthrobotrys flagrans]